MDPATALILSGAISSAGAIYNNSQNLQHQKWANDTQIHLANTAHQREVQDLRAAGLNPILSASGSGSAVPSLGVANMTNPGQGIADGISSASKYVSDEYKANVANIKANTANMDLVNTAQKYSNAIIKAEMDAKQEELAAAKKMAMLKNAAVSAYTGIYGDKIDVIMPKKFDAAVAKEVSGMESEANLKTWQNAREFINSARAVAKDAGDGYLDYKSRKFRR